MFRSYLTTAVRHLLKNPGYSLLHIAGLSIGVACFTLIALYVKDEVSFDRFHEKADRIYRVAGTFTDESGQFDQAVTCIPLAPALVNDLPEVVMATRIDYNDAVVQRGDTKFVESDIQAVDPSFLKMFDFRLLHGDPASALNDPYSIILSESMARKYFGNENPVGESIKIFQYDPGDDGALYKVTGVIEDCPQNSHFNYNFLFSFSTIEAVSPNSFGYDGWFNNGYFTYILVDRQADMSALKRKMSTFLEKYIGEDMKKNKIYWSYFLQPITDIHLKSNLRYEIKATSSVNNVIIFGSIGFVVLLLACINYINLSTARSSDRFKEVGIRKVMGAFKRQLIGQYLAESWILVMASTLVAVIWIELARPLFELLTGKVVTDLYSWETILTLVAIMSVAGVMSGLYPAVVLSSFRPVSVLKGQLRSGTSGVWLRKGLVIVQYSVTIVLVISILVIQLQMNFIQSRDLGFDKENLLILNVNGSGEVYGGFDAFHNELMNSSGVSGISRSSSFIAGGLGNRTASVTDATGKKVSGTIFGLGIDTHYIDTYSMTLVAGRNLVETDTASVIVNAATARTYGYEDPHDFVGTEISFGSFAARVVGVVRDFNYNTLHKKIEPTFMYLWQGGYSRIAIRLTGDVGEGISKVTTAWKKHFPNSVLDYSFADERVEETYNAEQRFHQIFLVFSFLSLIIATMGLFSLVSYSIQMRTKEIGIRRVLGATVGNILGMISREFVILVSVAAIIAIPIGYYFMHHWLQDFVYRIELTTPVFVFAGLFVIFIAWTTVSLQSIRAASANPVKSLRSE